MYNVSVIGNIGCGKSTLLHSLSMRQYEVAFEPVSDWKFLPKFYDDMKRWCFTLQVEILNSFKTMNINNKIVERSPWEACHIFAKNAYNNGLLSDDEYTLVENITHNVGYKPEVFIYLCASPELCMYRIKERNRECEGNITIEYITQLHELYENCITELKKEGKNVQIIDAWKSKEEICSEVSKWLDAM
jgi:deoxyadenosine/deoxycytidine kinase